MCQNLCSNVVPIVPSGNPKPHDRLERRGANECMLGVTERGDNLQCLRARLTDQRYLLLDSSEAQQGRGGLLDPSTWSLLSLPTPHARHSTRTAVASVFRRLVLGRLRRNPSSAGISASEFVPKKSRIESN